MVYSDAVHHGRNFDLGAYKDDRYVRCNNCGFMCQLDRDKTAPKGSRLGDGIKQPETQLNGAVTTADTTITVDDASSFPSSGYIYIFDTGTYATEGDASSTYTDATNAPNMNKVAYTGTSATSFTGCTSVTAHDDNMYVRGEVTVGMGCPLCGKLWYS